VLSISPLLAWFFTFILLLLAGRATARLVLAGRGRALTPRISSMQRNRELGHAAMSFGMVFRELATNSINTAHFRQRRDGCG